MTDAERIYWENRDFVEREIRGTFADDDPDEVYPRKRRTFPHDEHEQLMLKLQLSETFEVSNPAGQCFYCDGPRIEYHGRVECTRCGR